MTTLKTRKEVLEILPVEPYGRYLDRMDFDKMEKFVQMLVAGYVAKKGKAVVKSDIDLDRASDTINFVAHIVEVGTLKILNDNNLLGLSDNQRKDAIIAVGFSINNCMARALQAKGVYFSISPIYFSLDAMATLLERTSVHVDNSIGNSGYINSLVANYLLNKI